MNRRVSDCCGAGARGFAGPHGTIDCDTEDMGICPMCGEHCEFIDPEEEEDE